MDKVSKKAKKYAAKLGKLLIKLSKETPWADTIDGEAEDKGRKVQFRLQWREEKLS